jgi:transposase InsO family protein
LSVSTPLSSHRSANATLPTLILGQAHLRAVLAEYQEHYNTARPHQGIGQRIPDTEHHTPRITAAETWRIRRKPVLSGLINEYERAA